MSEKNTKREVMFKASFTIKIGRRVLSRRKLTIWS